MFNVFAKVTTGIDKTSDVKKLLDDLAKKQVYVGIPEGSDNERVPMPGNAESSSDITNAQLMYIHTHGIRHQEMRREMNPQIESGSVTYSKAYSMYLLAHGSPLWHSPPRPVIEPAIENSRDVIAKQLRKVADTALDGQDPTAEMQKAGMLGQNIARDWFTNPANGWAPNALSTIKAKGSENPLVDTGELRKSIVYVIQDGE